MDSMDSMDSHDMPPQAMPKCRHYPAYDAHGNPVAQSDVSSEEYGKCEKCKHIHVIDAFVEGFGACVYCLQGPLGNREDASEVRVSFAFTPRSLACLYFSVPRLGCYADVTLCVQYLATKVKTGELIAASPHSGTGCPCHRGVRGPRSSHKRRRSIEAPSSHKMRRSIEAPCYEDVSDREKMIFLCDEALKCGVSMSQFEEVMIYLLACAAVPH